MPIDYERDKQLLFLKRMQSLKKEAAKNGNMVTEEELRKRFEDLSLSDAQLDEVRAYLRTGGVGIGEPLPLEEVVSDEELDHLEEYRQLVDAIEIPSENILDALRLSAMAGERPAQTRRAEYSRRKVIDIARLYAGQGVYLEDLIGAGNEALTIAVTQLAPLEGPDEVDGYLGRRIMDAMEDLIAVNLDDKALDRQIEDLVNQVADKAAELSGELGRKVSVAELAAEYELEEEKIREALRLSGDRIDGIDIQSRSV